MANLNTAISVQISKEDKKKATEILQKLGVSMSGLINMTIKQLILRESIPFDVALPTKTDQLDKYFTPDELNRAAEELTKIEEKSSSYKGYTDTKELKESLLSDE